MSALQLRATVVEVGGIKPAVVLRQGDGREIRVEGLTENECRLVASFFLDEVVLTIKEGS